jgi:peptidoglycan/LPS O-acetylase OafA/YrhL
MLHQREIIASKAATYYPAFDYLRIVLATAVAANHAGLLTWEQSGNLPVQIFFALSGWLIGGILMRSKPNDLPRFYFNRSARIWIPYFAARDTLTAKWLEFVIYKFAFVYDFFGPPQLAQYRQAMPLQGSTNHFWSICAEEQFYLLSPIVIMLLPLGRSVWLWLAIFAATAASPFWNLFASIALGVSAVVLREKIGDWHQSRPVAALLLSFAAATFAAVYLGVAPYRIGAPLLSISLVLALAQPGSRSKIAEFLGGISYPMYLNHWLGMFLSNALYGKLGLRGTILSEVTGVVLAIAIAAALYIAIDRNVRANRERFYTPRFGAVAAMTGYALVVSGMIYGFTR